MTPAYNTITHIIDQDREEAIAIIHRQYPIPTYDLFGFIWIHKRWL